MVGRRGSEQVIAAPTAPWAEARITGGSGTGSDPPDSSTCPSHYVGMPSGVPVLVTGAALRG
jgi:hypothetical protein